MWQCACVAQRACVCVFASLMGSAIERHYVGICCNVHASIYQRAHDVVLAHTTGTIISQLNFAKASKAARLQHAQQDAAQVRACM